MQAPAHPSAATPKIERNKEITNDSVRTNDRGPSVVSKGDMRDKLARLHADRIYFM